MRPPPPPLLPQLHLDGPRGGILVVHVRPLQDSGTGRYRVHSAQKTASHISALVSLGNLIWLTLYSYRSLISFQVPPHDRPDVLVVLLL